MAPSPEAPSSGRSLDLLADTAGAFADAAGRSGEVVERSVRIAGHHIRLRFAGAAMVSALTRALAHLQPADGDPDLVVEIWDSASVGGNAPPSLPGKPEGTPDGVRILYDEGPVQAVYLPSERSLSLIDASSGRAWFWTADADGIPHWERAAPLRYILNSWLGAQGQHVVHAGAIAGRDGGVLLVGKGGSGKSTTALTCVQAGFSYAGDDYSLVSARPPTAHALYGSGKLHAHHVTRFPDLMPSVDNVDRLSEEKALIFVASDALGRFDDSFPIRAVAVPRVTGQAETRFSRASPAEALAALAPSSLFLMPGASATTMAAMADLLRQTPCYRLDLGTNLHDIPSAVRNLLASTSERD
jgi:hypothetical protein